MAPADVALAASRFADDCGACLGLCCVGLAFGRSHDFPFDKPAGTPCRNLDDDHRCRVHTQLVPQGYLGCVTYTCFGAGPLVTRAQAPASWRDGPDEAARLFGAFHPVRALQELGWHVEAALAMPLPVPLRDELLPVREQVAELAGRLAGGAGGVGGAGGAGGAGEPGSGVDPVAVVWDRAGALLQQASLALRGPTPGRDLTGASLLGARLAGADLRRASLRGAQLTGADLRRARLQGADLTGADLRDARLAGADLRGALFLTAAQLRAARGDARTRLPAGSVRPAHWAG